MFDFDDGKTEDIVSILLPKEPVEKRIENLVNKI